MPELPEAETLVRGIRPRVVDRTIATTKVFHADVLREPPDAFARRVGGRSIQRVSRRGKNVVLHLAGASGRRAGADAPVLLVNLGMTGRLVPVAPGAEPPADATHPAVRFAFRDGGRLVYDDTRRFGRLEVLHPEAWHERDQGLGPEPLDPTFTATDLHRGLSASRTPVRSWLLDQRRMAGVGNIYANEALHRARVHPARRARTLDGDEADRLHEALREVLGAAIRAGGTTIRDFRDADGDPGAYVRELSVYGRDGKACGRCGTEVERTVFGNRSAFFCPACQPPGG